MGRAAAPPEGKAGLLPGEADPGSGGGTLRRAISAGVIGPAIGADRAHADLERGGSAHCRGSLRQRGGPQAYRQGVLESLIVDRHEMAGARQRGIGMLQLENYSHAGPQSPALLAAAPGRARSRSMHPHP